MNFMEFIEVSLQNEFDKFQISWWNLMINIMVYLEELYYDKWHQEVSEWRLMQAYTVDDINKRKSASTTPMFAGSGK